MAAPTVRPLPPSKSLVCSPEGAFALDTKAPDAFRTISEVADELDLPQHVLRFWESRFREIKPMKRGGGRRYYRPDDVDLLRGIRHLLYGEGYTIRGVQRILREQGVKFVEAVWREGAPQPPHGAREEDVADEAAEIGERKAGFLGRLIGRDLADKEDDAPARPEPPMQSAPEPRVDPVERIAPTGGDAELPPEPSFVPSASRPAVLGRDELHKLHAALHELGECRKLIDKALTR
jgi:DNA-binding transcriptional MerR regulator